MFNKVMIKLDNVSLGFNLKQLFNNLNCVFEKGNIYGITGNNGCGKSVFLNMLLGKIIPDKGSLIFNNVNNILFVKNNEHGFENGSKSIKNKLLKLGFTKLLKCASNKDFVAIKDRMQCLRRAFSSGADVLLLDEPTLFLNKKQKRWLKRKLHTNLGIVIVTSHDVNFLYETCNYIWDMNSNCENFVLTRNVGP